MEIHPADDFSHFSDRDLLEIVRRPEGYSDREIRTAREEIERRGGLDALIRREKSAAEATEFEVIAPGESIASKYMATDPRRWNGLTELQIRKSLKWGMVTANMFGIYALSILFFMVSDEFSMHAFGVKSIFAVVCAALFGIREGISRGNIYCAAIVLVIELYFFFPWRHIGRPDFSMTFSVIIWLAVVYGGYRGLRGTLAYRAMLRDVGKIVA
ncbi:MAG: hypothetical protein ABIR47_05650 [Candidatus Kapaibacterium sp.]